MLSAVILLDHSLRLGTEMFAHPQFISIPISDVPLNQDLIIMDEKWIDAYEREWIRTFDGESGDPYSVGYVTRVAARSISDTWLELSWYVNIHNRFHEVPLFLPTDLVVASVDVQAYDEKPHIFVKSGWLEEIHERPFSTFALIDAIGIKALLQRGKLSGASLKALRDRIDAVAERYPSLAFISFADGLILKQVWSLGHIGSDIRYTYSPEALFAPVAELRCAIGEVLGADAYTVLTQGMNAFDDPVPLHVSAHRNHVSLNSLGVPFAQLMAIETAARGAIRAGVHGPHTLYMDSLLLHSLNINYEFRQSLPKWPYNSPMTRSVGATYVCTDVESVRNNLV